MASFDDETRELLAAPNIVQLGTIAKDGRPHITPVWADVDGGRILVNTAEGRVWPANVRRDPRVTLSVSPADDPYVHTMIRARVVAETHETADADIDRLAKKYMDADSYPYRKAEEQRVTFWIEPEQVSKHS